MASLQVVDGRGSVETIDRPQAPDDLTDEQAAEWWAIVDRMPADWFQRETHGLLAQYCRHVVSARRISQLIEKAIEDPDLSPKDYDRLLKMQEREGRALSALAVKMRIAQQSTSTHRANKGSRGARKPWEG